MIGLRADDDVDRRLAPDDLLALGLGHAAGDGDGQVAPHRPALGLDGAQTAQLGIYLLRGMLTNVAGVQHDQIGLLRPSASA